MRRVPGRRLSLQAIQLTRMDGAGSMTSHVGRFIAAHAAATGTQSREYADPFVSTQWAIAEIAGALDQAHREVTALQIARIEQAIERMDVAQTAVGRLLAQATAL